jgi:1,3-beta-glucanosyltransferase GAS5
MYQADIDTNRLQMAEYMNCGTDDERSDFFAFNDYSWCDPSSFTTSGWDQKVKNFTGYGLPLFLSEYGCNTNKRQFQEVGSLYSTQMTPVYSGGLVYEYSEEGSDYGLVTIDGSDVTEKDDYTELKNALKQTPNPQGDGNYNSTGGASGCPASDASNWDVSNDDLPAIPQPAQEYMTDGAGTGPGFSGSGSQNAGVKSSGTATPGSGSAAASPTSSTSQGAAPRLHAPETILTPVMCSAVVALCTLFGASLVIL